MVKAPLGTESLMFTTNVLSIDERASKIACFAVRIFESSLTRVSTMGAAIQDVVYVHGWYSATRSSHTMVR